MEVAETEKMVQILYISEELIRCEIDGFVNHEKNSEDDYRYPADFHKAY